MIADEIAKQASSKERPKTNEHDEYAPMITINMLLLKIALSSNKILKMLMKTLCSHLHNLFAPLLVS